MFEPTRILRDEHDVILQGLEILEACSEQLRAGETVAPDTLDSLIEFFRLFADKTHHGKEEALLFPAMIEKGFSRETGPIHCMLADHEQNRALTRKMIQASAELRAGDNSAAARFAEAAGDYVYVLREHIQKENMVLFNMAEQVLSPAEEPALLAKFLDVDQNQIGEAEIARLKNILTRVQEVVPVS
jgi:hemerythrin-like domain-containing protein